MGNKIMGNQNIELLNQWAAFWSSGNVESFLSLFIEDCYYEDMAFSLANKGKDELREFFIATRTALPDLNMQIKSCFASENNAAIQWVMRGTHKQTFHNVPATNQRIEVQGITYMDLKDGKINQNKDYYNLVTVLQQIGLFPIELSATTD